MCPIFQRVSFHDDVYPNLDKYVEITKSAWPASLNADYSQADAPSARPLDNENSRVLPDVHVSSVGPETYLDFFD